jgi:hypothetical protein
MSIIKYNFWSYRDPVYQEFILDLLKLIGPRYFCQEKIMVELQDVREIIFITEGYFDIGYTINLEEHYGMRQQSGKTIGGFEVAFDKRSYYIFNSKKVTKGFYLSKINWKQLMEKYEDFCKEIKKRWLTNIHKTIKPCLTKHR